MDRDIIRLQVVQRSGFMVSFCASVTYQAERTSVCVGRVKVESGTKTNTSFLQNTFYDLGPVFFL